MEPWSIDNTQNDGVDAALLQLIRLHWGGLVRTVEEEKELTPTGSMIPRVLLYSDPSMSFPNSEMFANCRRFQAASEIKCDAAREQG